MSFTGRLPACSSSLDYGHYLSHSSPCTPYLRGIQRPTCPFAGIPSMDTRVSTQADFTTYNVCHHSNCPLHCCCRRYLQLLDKAARMVVISSAPVTVGMFLAQWHKRSSSSLEPFRVLINKSLDPPFFEAFRGRPPHRPHNLCDHRRLAPNPGFRTLNET